MFSAQTESFLDWYRRLWRTKGGDDEKSIANVEKRLDVRLPELLRAVYLSTSLRDSQMLHLAELDEIKKEGGVLVFASEQQACWSWGIPLDNVSRSNPVLVANPGGRWEDDNCTLEDFLRFYVLTNRPYEPPFIDQGGYDEKRLNGAWKKYEVKWKSIQHSLWTNGEAALEEEMGNLGARDPDALRKAAHSLGIDDDEIDEALEEFGTGEEDDE
jgi:hypothetical protein